MEDNTSIWNKKQEDVTVGDSVKIAAGMTVVAMVIPFVVVGAVAGAEALGNKFKQFREDRRKNKLKVVE